MHPPACPDTSTPESVQAHRASLAVGLAPFLVLLAFTAVVSGLIDAEIGVAVFAACTAWVVYEMHRYQGSLDDADERALRAELSQGE
jgi:hypothetical protein